MLRELQLELSQAFRESGPDGVVSRRVLSGLRPVGRARPERTLAIYRSALREVVEAALRQIFPVCAELVGERCFRAIARRHAAAHASSHADLGRIGDDLPARLETLDFLASVPYLPDVARLELALHAAADAPEVEAPVDAARVADALASAPDEWRLCLDPSITLLDPAHPVRAIWEAHRTPEADGVDGWAGVGAAAPERLIVWRSAEGPCVEPVVAGLWPVLEAIGSGGSVADLLALGAPPGAEPLAERLAAEPADHETMLAALALLFERRWITGVEPVAAGRPPRSVRASAGDGARDREPEPGRERNPMEEAST